MFRPERPAHPLRRARAWLAEESGSATIESVLWLPIFLAFFSLVADTAMVFNNRSLALKLVQDTNRSRAIGRLPTDAAAQTYLQDQIKSLSPSAQASVVTNSSRIVTSRLSIPIREIDATGLFGKFANLQVVVQAQHLTED
jgi:hypothetical protein